MIKTIGLSLLGLCVIAFITDAIFSAYIDTLYAVAISISDKTSRISYISSTINPYLAIREIFSNLKWVIGVAGAGFTIAGYLVEKDT
jgi:hypothetical protein